MCRPRSQEVEVAARTLLQISAREWLEKHSHAGRRTEASIASAHKKPMVDSKMEGGAHCGRQNMKPKENKT